MTQRGSAAVEFALLLPLVLLLALLLADVAALARTQIEIVNAARVGARQAATDPEPSHAVDAVRHSLGAAARDVRVEVSRPHVVGRPAVVVVKLPRRLAAPLFGGVEVVLRARAVMRVEQ